MTQFTVKGTTLLEAIAWSAKGLSKKSAIEHALITGKLRGSKLTLTSRSDSSAFNVTTTVNRSGSEQGDADFIVEGSEFQQRITHLKSEDISVEIGKGSIVAKGARARFEIPTVVGALLPRTFPQNNVGTILAGALREAVASASVAAAGQDEPIELLRSIKIEFYPEDQKIRLVGCDRYQLIYREIEYSPSSTAQPPNEILIPGASLKNLVAKVPDALTMDIMCEEDNIYFGLESSELDGYVRSITAEYIPYHKMLAAPTPKSFLCPAHDMEQAVQTVASMRETTTEGVLVELVGDVATVKTIDGRSKMEIDVVREDSDDADISFSFMPRYITNALRSATSEDVRWKFSPQAKTVTFESLEGTTTDADDSIKFVAAAKRK